MSFLKRTVHVEGPSVNELKTTFENICDELNSGYYQSGIDPETMANMMVQLYRHITNTSNGKPLSLPAPINDPDDTCRILWPEGARVRTRSRRDSHASAGSSKTPSGILVPNMRSSYGSSVASSVKSSRYAPVKARFMDETGLDEDVRSMNLADIRRSQPTRASMDRGPMNAPARPQQSQRTRSRRIIEDDDEDDEVQRVSTRKSSASQRRREPEVQQRKHGKQPVEFIDDE